MHHSDEIQITLSDGRRLGCRITGRAGAPALFYFHGFPGSRLEASWLCNGVARCDWRIYAFDRPGMGTSDFLHGRTLLDWPRDIAEFADIRGIERFTILGVSGGGPYAAVCAWALPQRVQAAGIVCGLGPIADAAAMAGMRLLNRGMFHLLQRFPKIARPAYAPLAAVFKRWPLALLDMQRDHLASSDRAALTVPAFRETLSASFQESVRQGSLGGEHELRIYSRPWGFDVGAIRVPVGIWHGELDRIVPCAMGRRLAAHIPRCNSTFFPEEGHYSLLVHRRATILEALLRMHDEAAW